MSAAASSRPLVVWRFADGRRGHEEQTLGLCEALARLTPIVRHDVALTAGRGRWRRWPVPPQAPDLIVGAGHRTHLPMLAARRRHGGHVAVVMRPTLPLALFDSAIVPRHDRPPARPSVLATIGALGRVRRGRPEPHRGLVLIGGPSRHFLWDDERVLACVGTVLARDAGRSWLVADSPRTPATLSARLAALDGVRFVHHADSGPDWLRGEIARAGCCWLTPDSVSMLHEALSAGVATGVFALVPRRGSRVAHGVAQLVAEGRVRGWQAWLDGAPLAPAPPLDETTRAARWLLDRVAPERIGR